MKYNKQSGFTAVELLITLFIAAAFLMSGYQIYNLIIQDGSEARSQSRANNEVYDYLQQYKSAVTVPCTVQTPLTNSPIIVDKLSFVDITVNISCPYGTSSSISKISVNLRYNNPQVEVSNATYATK